MLIRNAYLPWIVILVLVVSANTVFVKPAHANDTAKILASIAVGALVYTALDDCDKPTNHYYDDHGRDRSHGDINKRYDPPRRYGYSYENPKEAYDRGYDDGFKDGRDYGRYEGYGRGYDRGYSDGKYDRKGKYNIGKPYERYRR